MANKDRDTELARATQLLEDSFRRWDYLSENGGSDPFHADGENLNLVRNHILADKLAIDKLMQAEPEELSFFGSSYPDIYYRETPAEVPNGYMVKETEIRQRAAQQLALYEKDPNFLYCLENHKKVFPKGETRATKEAGLSIWSTRGLTKYQNAIASDDLVAMRSVFYEPYEEKAPRWAEYAKAMRSFLETEHRPEDNVLVPDVFEEEYLEQDCVVKEAEPVKSERKPTLDARIDSAKVKADNLQKAMAPREDQLSLF